MQTCCLGCVKTQNIGSRKVTMTNTVIRENSKCFIVWLINQDF